MIEIVGKLTGQYSVFKRVFPHDVVVYLPVERSTRQVRRDMVRLAEAGYLERLGERKGYRLPDACPLRPSLSATMS